MGGVINVAIRFKDGRTICQERWTNNFPYWFRHPKMYEGDETHINEYLAMTRNNDYIADPGAPGTPQPLRNSEYGLIVWDYMTGHLLDNNTYSHPNRMDVIYFDTQREEFDRLAEAGRFRFRTITIMKNGGERSQTVSGLLTAAEAVEIAQFASDYDRKARRRDGGLSLILDKDGKPMERAKEEGEDFTHYDFIIDTDPLTVCTFKEGDWKPYKAKLIELGFPMTQKQGLNASLPKIRKRKGEVSHEEITARELYQKWQVSDQGKDFEGKNYDGVLFDDIPEFIQKQFLNHAVAILADPEKSASHAFGKLFGV